MPYTSQGGLETLRDHDVVAIDFDHGLIEATAPDIRERFIRDLIGK
jgi:hypothetical protein